MPDAFPQLGSISELRDIFFAFTGAGAADPTKTHGQRATVTWISTGLYELTFAENPGAFVGATHPAFQATTAADLKGYTGVFGDFNATTRKLRLSITGASDALVDLTSTQKVQFRVAFMEKST